VQEQPACRHKCYCMSHMRTRSAIASVCHHKQENMPYIQGPKKSILGPLGRGVLRFWKKAYRNPVHILLKIAIFPQNRPF